jgi:hypothetical protein
MVQFYVDDENEIDDILSVCDPLGERLFLQQKRKYPYYADSP